MAERVVDRLEAVEVEEQHGDPGARADRRRPARAGRGRGTAPGSPARSAPSWNACRVSCSSSSLRSEMSRTMTDAPVRAPAASQVGEMVSATAMRWPSRWRMTVSNSSIGLPAAIRTSRSRWSPSQFGRATAGPSPAPDHRSWRSSRRAARRPAFHEKTTPSRVTPMMASREDSTIAASRARHRSGFLLLGDVLDGSRTWWSPVRRHRRSPVRVLRRPARPRLAARSGTAR